jgi:hypothetical protein
VARHKKNNYMEWPQRFYRMNNGKSHWQGLEIMQPSHQKWGSAWWNTWKWISKSWCFLFHGMQNYCNNVPHINNHILIPTRSIMDKKPFISHPLYIQSSRKNQK